jgi:hypothetical protein
VDDDRRKHSRFELQELAYISSGGACWSCTLVNLSTEGAAIELADPTVVPDRFVLMIARDRRMFNCRFAWSQHNRIGISFEVDGALPKNTSVQPRKADEPLPG